MCPVGWLKAFVAVLWEDYGKKVLGFIAAVIFAVTVWILAILAILGSI